MASRAFAWAYHFGLQLNELLEERENNPVKVTNRGRKGTATITASNQDTKYIITEIEQLVVIRDREITDLKARIIELKRA